MQFIITAHDGENMLEKRMAVRPRHLEGMAKLGRHISWPEDFWMTRGR